MAPLQSLVGASALVYVLINLLAPVISEELRDVWHYDHGVAKVMKPSIGSGSTNETHKLSDNEPKQSSRNKTVRGGKSQKLVEIDLEDEEDANRERCDFRGQHLRVAVSPQPPLVNCLQDSYGDWLCNGSNIQVIRVLEKRLNFVADWVVLASGQQDDDVLNRNTATSQSRKSRTKKARKSSSQGDTQEGSTKASGIFHLVATGRALMSANGVMQTIDRSHLNLIVSEAFDQFELHFLLSKSVRDHDHIFIKPFDPQAWLAILTSAAMIVPIFYLINSTSRHYALLDDKPLRKLALWHCVKTSSASILKNTLNLNKRRRLSSSTSLDKELDKMLQIENTRNDLHFAKSGQSSAFEMALISRPQPVRGESKRRRRLARRQWAYERRQAIKWGRKSRKTGFFNPAYIVWYVVASLSNQGGETEDLPHANSTRILIAFWWLYLIVICAIHSGILTAILTFPKQIDFIQTLDDYLTLEPSERDSLKLSVDKHSELAHLLINSDNLHKSPLQLLQNQSIPIAYVNFQRHRQRILDDIQQGRSALMEEKSTISQIITQEYDDSQQAKCLFKSSRYAIDVIPMSFILNKNMPQACIKLINKTLRRIMQTGLTQKWRRNYESSGNDCLNTVVINAGDVDKIELKHVILAIWVLCLGALIGLLFLIAEIIWLFMVEDEDDDDDESSTSSDSSFTSTSSSSSDDDDDSSTSSGSDRIRLGFRRALMPSRQQLMSIRSLKTKKMPIRKILRKTRRQQKRAENPLPKITVSPGTFDDDDDDEHDLERGSESPRLSTTVDVREGIKEFKSFHARHLDEKRARRMAREAQRRARRIQKTIDLFKRLHGGKIYANKLKQRMRRMSHSVMSHISQHPLDDRQTSNGQIVSEIIGQGQNVNLATMMRRRKRSSLGFRVAPVQNMPSGG